MDIHPLDEDIVERGIKRAVVDPEALGEMSLGVEVDHEYIHAELGEPEGVKCRNTRLPCSPFEIQEDLPALGGNKRRLPEGMQVRRISWGAYTRIPSAIWGCGSVPSVSILSSAAFEIPSREANSLAVYSWLLHLISFLS